MPAPDDMLAAELAAIKERERSATLGPWRMSTDSCDCGDGYGCSHGSWPHAIVTPRPHAEPKPPGGYRDYDYSHTEISELTMEDVEFIVAARTDIPRLLAALDAVLKLADTYDAESKRLWGQVRDADSRGVMTGSKSIDAAWNGEVAKAIRDAIARELAGKEARDA